MEIDDNLEKYFLDVLRKETTEIKRTRKINIWMSSRYFESFKTCSNGKHRRACKIISKCLWDIFLFLGLSRSKSDLKNNFKTSSEHFFKGLLLAPKILSNNFKTVSRYYHKICYKTFQLSSCFRDLLLGWSEIAVWCADLRGSGVATKLISPGYFLAEDSFLETYASVVSSD